MYQYFWRITKVVIVYEHDFSCKTANRVPLRLVSIQCKRNLWSSSRMAFSNSAFVRTFYLMDVLSRTLPLLSGRNFVFEVFTVGIFTALQ